MRDDDEGNGESPRGRRPRSQNNLYTLMLICYSPLAVKLVQDLLDWIHQ